VSPLIWCLRTWCLFLSPPQSPDASLRDYDNKYVTSAKCLAIHELRCYHFDMNPYRTRPIPPGLLMAIGTSQPSSASAIGSKIAIAMYRAGNGKHEQLPKLPPMMTTPIGPAVTVAE